MGQAEPFELAVIGGGVSGSAIVLALSRSVASGYRAALFDPRPPGPGTAYGEQPESLRMNGPVRAMSVVPGDEAHLIRWLNGSEEPHALISRKRYGDYVAQAVQAALVSHPGVEYRADEIVDIEPSEGAYLLTSMTGEKYVARDVVLALGNATPDDSFLPSAVREHPGYIGDPWHLDVTQINGDVAIVGSRLTAMDVLSALEERGFAGTVHLISRHGLLPELEDTRIRGLDLAGLSLDTASPYTLLRSMRRLARSHVASGGDWRAVAESIRPISACIWLGWNVRERRRFLRHLESFWMAHRYRVPAATHAAYRRLHDGGKVRIVRGRISEAVALDANTLRMTVTRAGETARLSASTIINATGPNADYTKIDRPLIRNARKRGLIRADALRLGLDTSLDLQLISRAGDVQPHLLTIGPPLRGTFYECTAVPEIRKHAQKIVTALAEMHANRELGAVS